MKTTVRQTELQELAHQLQQRLEEKVSLPLQVQCAVYQGSLVVLTQHSAQVAIDPPTIFAILTEALSQSHLQAIAVLSSFDPLPIRLLLRLLGQAKPYAGDRLLLKAPAQDLAIADVAKTEPVPQNPSTEEVTPAGQLVHLPTHSHPPEEALPAPEADLKSTPDLQSSRFRLSPSSLPTIAVGAALSLFVVSIGAFMVTRPCVVGQCFPLEDAKRLSKQAEQDVQTVRSPQEVVSAYEHLTEASYLLSTIPPWSGQYQTAQDLLKTYEARSAVMRQVVEAQQQAMAAAQTSQNPPHSIQVWEDIREHWQKAIALLEQVPRDNPLYALAQQKLKEYRTNLTTIDRRITIEQQAQQKIKQARSTADIAEARGGAATNLDAWKLTYSTWQVAVNLLKAVPQGTMSYAEAQQLLAIYQPKLAGVRTRTTQEEISARVYAQALEFAEQAKRSQQQNQWSQAVSQWQDALTHLQQVPNATSYFNQAQPLVASYSAALTTAQETLRTSIALQNARPSLEQTCAGSPRICTYSLGTDLIQLQVTPEYDRILTEARTQAQLTGNYSAGAPFFAHANALLRAIAAIGENAQVPIEVYNSDGSPFATYLPTVQGFVPR